MAATRTPLQLSPVGPAIIAGVARRYSAAQPFEVPSSRWFPSMPLAAGASCYGDQLSSEVATELVRTGRLTLQAESRFPSSAIYVNGAGAAVQFESLKDAVDVNFWDGTKRLASGATFYSDELHKPELDRVWQQGLVRIVP